MSSKKDIIDWSYERELSLCSSVYKHKAFSAKVGDLTMEIKWTNVTADVKIHPFFQAIPPEKLTIEALKRKFRRMVDVILTKYKFEGRNIRSGLSEDIDMLDIMMIDMIETDQKLHEETERRRLTQRSSTS